MLASDILPNPRQQRRPPTGHVGHPAASARSSKPKSNSRKRSMVSWRSPLPPRPTSDRPSRFPAHRKRSYAIAIASRGSGRRRWRRVPESVTEQKEVVQEPPFPKAIKKSTIRSHIRLKHCNEQGPTNQEWRQSHLPPKAGTKLVTAIHAPNKSTGAIYDEFRG